ncbi:hypothetical protein [Salidesulfovibrio onnuriiensis]|uniref:hypothetical protein n=1 Tax=Salidesulfovibrio onnuriiensis TaxID=2583823 RepID=UPI0011C995E8|nr:hypothetical protein [Salidesulfovibrio onnuriiensis]
MKPEHLSESWEMMLYCKEVLGATQLQKIFSRGHTQINRYCMNPKFEDSQRNPLDRLREMLGLMADKGENELVRTALNHLAAPHGCRLREKAQAVPDKATIEEECLDDFPELVELDRLINLRKHPDVVRRQAEQVFREIEETLVLYEELWNKNEG